MVRTQIQLPDRLYQEAKRVADERELTLAEVVRRGLEHMIQLYPPRGVGDWQPPAARHLGSFRAPDESWRELANQVS